MSGGKTWRLSDEIRFLDPTGPQLPVHAKILIAGCGTGSEAAQVASKYPDAAVTAIDISQTSLNYARERWTALKLRDVRFVRLDLHKVSELNERFDAIFSSGVLHHLAKPGSRFWRRWLRCCAREESCGSCSTAARREAGSITRKH